MLPPLLWINLNAFHVYLRTLWTSSRLCHNLFMSAPSVVFQRSNLGNFLVGAKLHNPSQNTIPPMLFSMQQPLLYVHRYIKLAYFLHIPFHRLRISITHHIVSNSKTLIYRIQCKPCQTICRRNKATTQRSPQQTTQTRQLTSPPTYQNISLLIITPLMTSPSFH